MKVLFVADVAESGGATKSLISMIGELKSVHDIEPIIAVSKKGIVTSFCEKNNINYIALGYRQFYINAGSTWLRKLIRVLFRPYLWIRYVICNKMAINLAEKEVDFSSIDIIHTNTEKNDIGAILAKRNRIPHIWHLRAYGDLDYECFSLIKKYIDFMNLHTDYFVMVSENEMRHWIKRGLDRNKCTWIYNGFDTNQFKKKCFDNDSDNRIHIVMLGFISPNKGQIQVIKALSKMNDVYRKHITFDIYGSGAMEYVAYLKLLVKKNNLSDIVCFKGTVNDIHRVLSDYDIGMNCSKAEAFGRITIEYMLSNLCVIASDTGANTELICNETNGLLYEYGNIEDLKQKICRLVDNVELKRLLANKGNEFAQNFTTKRYATEIYSLYEKCIVKMD